jgi:hypothetical protein
VILGYLDQDFTITNPSLQPPETSPEFNMSIPTTCRAAVVKNEGADFFLAIEDVKVPEPGQ